MYVFNVHMPEFETLEIKFLFPEYIDVYMPANHLMVIRRHLHIDKFQNLSMLIPEFIDVNSGIYRCKIAGESPLD